MPFLTPLFLLLGLLAGPIILLYMLRLRRQEMRVSSTLLWQKLLRDREANAPWQRLRRNLLLILQLLILAFLVLALARPFIPVSTVVSGNVVVLLDASASMQATDVEPNRFAAAQADLNRFGSIEKEVAVIGVHFKALTERFEEALERAVSGEDIKELKREWETALRETNSNIREYFNTANEQQSTNILGQVAGMLATDRLAASEDQKSLRRQIFFALFTWGLGIIGALFVFWLTTRSA